MDVTGVDVDVTGICWERGGVDDDSLEESSDDSSEDEDRCNAVKFGRIGDINIS